jgi:hypothetical protein
MDDKPSLPAEPVLFTSINHADRTTSFPTHYGAWSHLHASHYYGWISSLPRKFNIHLDVGAELSQGSIHHLGVGQGANLPVQVLPTDLPIISMGKKSAMMLVPIGPAVTIGDTEELLAMVHLRNRDEAIARQALETLLKRNHVLVIDLETRWQRLRDAVLAFLPRQRTGGPVAVTAVRTA